MASTQKTAPGSAPKVGAGPTRPEKRITKESGDSLLPQEAADIQGPATPGLVNLLPHRLSALFVLLSALIVYFLTVAKSVPFWDCGEFSACAYTLSVPHPPGSPLFLLVGRLFTLLPFPADIAYRVSLMSAILSAFAIFFLYLSIVMIIRHWRGPERTVADQVIVYGSGIIGSLALCFSESMWFNAVECEVYAFAQFFTHIVVWLILLWSERADRPGSERILILIAYIMGLATGVHLLNVLTIPTLALVIYFRKHAFSWGSFLGMCIAATAAFMAVYPGVVKWFPGSAAKLGMWAPLAIVIVLVLAFAWAARAKSHVVATALISLLLIVVGYSTYSMIYIRSHMDTPIDENDPQTPSAFLSYLNREQYGEHSIVDRAWNNDSKYRSESDFFWRYQINKMYNRYLLWQFVGREGAPELEVQDAGVQNSYLLALPFLLGLLGIGYLFYRDRRMGLAIFVLFVMTGYAIIIYVNQDDPQPRERDYSYVGSFYVFAIWIGIGATAVLDGIASLLRRQRSRIIALTGAGAFLFIFTPGIMLVKNFPMQNRTGNYVAEDYSYNMLMSCEPNGILFTNGDNDTFPLWYLQEVQGIRKDVRIANLSLLNTGWYIKQLRDRTPKVPLSFNDAYIDRFIDERDATALLSRYWPKEKQRVELDTPNGKMVWNMPATLYVPYKQGERDKNFLRVQDMMVLDIIRTNYDLRKTPNPRPVYFAVTVATSNLCGLRDFLTMEGLVFRLKPGRGDIIDAGQMFHNIAEVYRDHYRGLNDPRVHFDDNVQRLLQNYRSSFLQLAYYYMNMPEDTQRTTLAYSAKETRVEDFGKLSNHDKALFLLDQMEYYIPEELNPIMNADLTLQLGKMYYDLGRPDELRRRLDWAAREKDLPVETLARYAAILYQVFQDSVRVHGLVDRILQSKDPKIAQAASTLYGVRDWAEAARLYEYAMKENPEDGQTVGALIQCYERTGRYQDGIQTIRKWLQTHPNDAGATSRLDYFEKLLATAPSDTEAQ